MYAGAMTDATPTPMPPTTRNSDRLATTLGARRGTDRADQEQQRRDLHHRNATDRVGDPACGHRADCGTEQRRRHGEAQLRVVDTEVVLDRVDTAPLITALS